MKAVVLEIKDGYAAVLSEDGQFRKIRDDGYLPGMELTLEAKNTVHSGKTKESGKKIDFRSRRLWKSVATLAAALMVFIGVKDFYTPYGTVSMDVNPSIEISINRYDRVLSIEAVNDDAEELVDELNASGLKYKSVDDAVDQALNSFSGGDYEADDGTTYVVISAHSGSHRHSDKIADELDHVCKDHEDISAQTVTVSDELQERAKKSGTTAGKLYLVDSLKDASSDEDFDEAEWLDKPVKEILREIDERKDSVKDAPTEPKTDSVPEPKPDAPDAPDAPEDTVSDEPEPDASKDPAPDVPAVPEAKSDAPDAPEDTVSDEPVKDASKDPAPDVPAVPEAKSDAPDAPEETVSDEPVKDAVPEPKPAVPDEPGNEIPDEPCPGALTEPGQSSGAETR